MTANTPETGATGTGPGPGPAPGPAAGADVWAATFASQNAETEKRIDEALNGPHGHTAGEWHSGRFRLIQYGFDLGTPGITLTVASAGIVGHRVADFPFQVNTWKLTGSPAAGTVVVDVLKAANLAAFNAGTYTTTTDAGRLTITGQREGNGAALGVWPVVDWLPGEVLIWQLVSISGAIEVLSGQIGARRT